MILLSLISLLLLLPLSSPTTLLVLSTPSLLLTASDTMSSRAHSSSPSKVNNRSNKLTHITPEVYGLSGALPWFCVTLGRAGKTSENVAVVRRVKEEIYRLLVYKIYGGWRLVDGRGLVNSRGRGEGVSLTVQEVVEVVRKCVGERAEEDGTGLLVGFISATKVGRCETSVFEFLNKNRIVVIDSSLKSEKDKDGGYAVLGSMVATTAATTTATTTTIVW